jgi:hypothetical protein
MEKSLTLIHAFLEIRKTYWCLLSVYLELVTVVAVRFTKPTNATKLQLIVIMTPSEHFHPLCFQTLKVLSAWFLLHKIQEIAYH